MRLGSNQVARVDFRSTAAYLMTDRLYAKLPVMGFVSKFIARAVLNGVALYLANQYFPGFILSGGITTLAVAALTLAFLNAFVRPILHLIATPLIWLTLGLANILIHIAILWLADMLLTQVAISDLATLFWVSIIIAIANAFF